MDIERRSGELAERAIFSGTNSEKINFFLDMFARVFRGRKIGGNGVIWMGRVCE